MKNKWITGKTVIISGASGGLGFNVAKKLIVDYDCKIIGIARNEKKMLANIETLGDKASNFSYYLFDVSVKENWQNFAEQLENAKIVPDVLINNAGFMLRFAKHDKISLEEKEEIVKTNLLSCVYSIEYLLPLLRKSETPSIVNIVSAAGHCPVVGQSMYTATKFALKGLTETLIQDYKGQNLYIGGVYPGFIQTDILQRSPKEATSKSIIEKVMMPVDRATKKTVKGIVKRKKRTVLGMTGHYMSVCGRHFPRSTPSLVRWFLKIFKLELFKDVFEEDFEEKK